MTEVIGPLKSKPLVQLTIESFISMEASIRARLVALMAALLTAALEGSTSVRHQDCQNDFDSDVLVRLEHQVCFDSLAEAFSEVVPLLVMAHLLPVDHGGERSDVIADFDGVRIVRSFFLAELLLPRGDQPPEPPPRSDRS